MTPDQVISKLIDVNRPAAIYLLGGMSVLAAAAIVLSWKIDVNAALVVAIYILVFAGVLLLLVFVFNDPLFKRILGGFSIALFMSWTACIFVSAVAPGRTFLPSPVCLIQILRDDCNFSDKEAIKNYTAIRAVTTTVPAPSGPVRRADFFVFVQFAGIIVRDDVKTLMRRLLGEDWKVQGVEGGGERTAKAAGYNEIRYSSDDDENAAKDLARAVQAANLTTKVVTITKSFAVPKKTLEVWISR